MARTPLSAGRWLRLVFLTLWAAALVAVIAAGAVAILSSRRVTPSAVALVTSASAVLYVVVESMGLEARPPPAPALPWAGLRRPRTTGTAIDPG